MNTTMDNVDYGPLFQLLGKWVGERGLDIAPDAQAQPDKTAYSDELIFSAAGPAENAEEQQLVAVKYHHIVRKKENGKIFHDQIGHWIYESATGLIMHSLTIPRGVCILAGGTIKKNQEGTHFEVKASVDSDDFGILQSPFMKDKAKTKSFAMTLSINADELSYQQTMSLDIYGKQFEHVDKSKLRKVTYDD
ncbi:MAG: FABP family protein [Kangiellaceae bacterium]|nr:FABP family protein [Kangiellaceae bacterium]